MSKMTNEERLVKLETLMTQVLEEIKELRIDYKSNFQRFTDQQKHDEDVMELREMIKAIQAKRWVQNTLSAILGAVLAFLLNFFAVNVGG